MAPFYASARSVANLTPSDLAYFDDIVAYKSIDEIVNESKLAARPWDANACDSVSAETFTRTNISAAVGSAVGNNTGQNSVTFRAGTDGQFTATAFGSASRNISSGIGTSGEGIGTIATGSSTSTATTVNSGSNEFLRFQFLNPGRSLGITLVDFGNLSSGPLHFERVQFRFLLASVQVGSTVTKSACKTGPVQANYSVDPGGLFDEVEVRPVSTLASENSALLVGSIRTCGVGVAPAACFAPTRVASNDCP